jgi:hypothetical protein
VSDETEETTEPGKKKWVFKKWYEENKVPFNEKRRNRYNTDPEYRQYVLEMNKKNREKRQKERFKEDRERKKAVKIVASPSWKEFESDEGKPMLTIGALAKALGRSTQSIRLWEKHGVIPVTPHRNARGDRLYTPEQVLDLYKTLKDTKDLERVETKTDLTPISSKVKFSDGRIEETSLFKVGALSKAVDRTVLTLEQMERKGVFPATPFRGDPNKLGEPGPRYYTAQMIESVKIVFDEMGGIRLRGDTRKKEFLDKITAAWKSQGVIGAELVKEVVQTT